MEGSLSFFYNIFLTFSIIENTITTENPISENGEVKMPRAKFNTLTEQMFYVLLCLQKECCGMDVLEQIPAMTGGRVHIGSGTLYDLLEQFTDVGLIHETKREGRRRSYTLTEAGTLMLQKEYGRLCAQVQDYQNYFGVRGNA